MIVETAKKNFDYQFFAGVRRRAFGRLMWRLKRQYDNFVEPRLHELGFRDFKMSYLAFLSNLTEEGITNNELAKQACVTKQAMSKVVTLLEQEGYIYTQKNQLDSRSSRIFLNDRGEALLLALHQCMQEARQKFDAIVGHDRMEHMIDTMIELTDQLEKEEQ